MTVYLVQRGNKPWAGISIITPSKDYAEGYAAGLNHCSKRYWHRVEEIEPLPAGTPVTYWLGEREGEGQPGTISGPLKLIGGTPRQNIKRAGPIPITHIEPIEQAA